MMNENLSTRKFLKGRTDGIYSISKDSISFCKIFEDPHASTAEKSVSLRKAVESHKQEANLASNGRGLIRLFTLLRTTAVENGIPLHDFFTGAAYQTSRHVTLVTSQVSTECDSATFFEPFVSDGYAIFYNVQSDSLTFAISSCKSCPETSSAKFKEALEKSLVQMGDCLDRSEQNE
ncbi:carnitine O-acetyltransferase [Ixodes scapularis]